MQKTMKKSSVKNKEKKISANCLLSDREGVTKTKDEKETNAEVPSITDLPDGMFGKFLGAEAK